MTIGACYSEILRVRPTFLGVKRILSDTTSSSTREFAAAGEFQVAALTGAPLPLLRYWDPETHFAEPRFPLLPSSERTPRQFKKFWHGAPFYLLVGPLGSLFRLKNLLFNPTFRKNANAADFLPWLMFLIGLAIKKNPVKALPLWAVMQGFATFTLLTIASTTSHNKPDEERGPWHQGDPNMPTGE